METNSTQTYSEHDDEQPKHASMSPARSRYARWYPGANGAVRSGNESEVRRGRGFPTLGGRPR